jgi:hypothetical protein
MMKPYFNLSCSVLLFFVFLGYSSQAQNIQVNAKLDKSSISMGDQTTLSLSAALPVKEKISFPALTDTISSKIQIVKAGKTDTVSDPKSPGLQTITQRYIITSFDAGIQVVPAFSFQSGTQHFVTASIPLEVIAVKVDTTKAIYDIKQPLAVSYSWIDWLKDHWLWVAGPVLLIVVLAGVIYYLRKRPKKGPPPVVVPIVPPDQLALNKLQSIKDQKLWEQGHIKRYYSELSDVIQKYLESRYQIKALEHTSEEIFLELRHKEMPQQQRANLRQMLNLADLVKFAKERPLNTENELSMEHAIGFIKQTKESPVRPENKAYRSHDE